MKYKVVYGIGSKAYSKRFDSKKDALKFMDKINSDRKIDFTALVKNGRK